MLSSMAAPDQAMERFLSGVKTYCAAPDSGSARFWGVDLEGNFLKDPAYSGMQDASSVKAPDIALFERESVFARDIQDRFSRNPEEYLALGRRDERAPAHAEEVGARALGDTAFFVH